MNEFDDAEIFFKKDRGITMVAAQNGFAKYTAVDMVRFATKFSDKENSTLLNALIEAKEMLIDKGVDVTSPGIVGIDQVIKKASE